MSVSKSINLNLVLFWDLLFKTTDIFFSSLLRSLSLLKFLRPKALKNTFSFFLLFMFIFAYFSSSTSIAADIINSGGEGIHLIKIKDDSGVVNLEIEYYGFLTDDLKVDRIQSGKTPLQVYVKLNGRDGLYGFNHSQPYYDSLWKRYRAFVKIVLTPSWEDAQRCSWKTFAPDLFVFSKDQNGNLNTWDVSLAFQNIYNGVWDSKNGNNYHFFF